MNLVVVLFTGLLAGGISCAAVQGGLLTGLITRQHAGDEPAVPCANGEARSWRSRLGDDLAPVGGFLAGKLAVYTLLGALLGALGGVVRGTLCPPFHNGADSIPFRGVIEPG